MRCCPFLPMKPRCYFPCLALLALTGSASAIKIEIRYDYDTNGFFNQPGAKEAMRSVADYFEGLIHDSLSAIDHTQWPAGNTWTASFEHPATGNTATIDNLKVPDETLIIFAGGRALGVPAGRGGVWRLFLLVQSSRLGHCHRNPGTGGSLRRHADGLRTVGRLRDLRYR